MLDEKYDKMKEIGRIERAYLLPLHIIYKLFKYKIQHYITSLK